MKIRAFRLAVVRYSQSIEMASYDFFPLDIFKEAPRLCKPPQTIPVKRREDVFKYGFGHPLNDVESFKVHQALVRKLYGAADDAPINHNVKTIYCTITYPFAQQYTFKFTLRDDVAITHMIILFAYTRALQILELIDAPSTHVLEEIVFNGGSYVEYGTDYIVCEFDFDS